MQLEVEGILVDVDGLEQADLEAIHASMARDMSNSNVKVREAIAAAFTLGLQRCPTINPSDLWHHVIYREYVRTAVAARRVRYPSQSWVRASGDAFEIFLQDYYNSRLVPHGVRLLALFSDADSASALSAMGIQHLVSGSKLDLSIRAGGGIIGGIHAKASLAERVSDDVPASRAMMSAGYLSALVTLDVKSFPASSMVSASRAYQNRGELGTPTNPTDKRAYIEQHGSFDLCLSYNLRTVPSLPQTTSGKRIYVAQINGPMDALEQAILQRLGTSIT